MLSVAAEDQQKKNDRKLGKREMSIAVGVEVKKMVCSCVHPEVVKNISGANRQAVALRYLSKDRHRCKWLYRAMCFSHFYILLNALANLTINIRERKCRTGTSQTSHVITIAVASNYRAILSTHSLYFYSQEVNPFHKLSGYMIRGSLEDIRHHLFWHFNLKIISQNDNF